MQIGLQAQALQLLDKLVESPAIAVRDTQVIAVFHMQDEPIRSVQIANQADIQPITIKLDRIDVGKLIDA